MESCVHPIATKYNLPLFISKQTHGEEAMTETFPGYILAPANDQLLIAQE